MKKVLFIFPNEWLSYTPTVINMIAGLRDSFEIKVIATDNGNYKNEFFQGKEFDFISLKGTFAKVIYRLGKFLGNQRLYELLKMLVVYWRMRRYQADEVIAVDALGLWLAQKVYHRTHFLSLEPYQNFLFKQCKTELIESVITQTQERYDYLFKSKIKTFLIQNSPAFSSSNISQKQSSTKQVIYFGSAIPRNGIYFCLEAIAQLPDMSLTIKGTMSPEVRQHIAQNYAELLEQQRIVIDNDYLEQDKVIEYLSQFYIGFCFYDLSCTDATTRFNFVSVPSGKLFNYYAAGVPVIGSDLLGLKSAKDFQAGILLKHLSAENIIQAIKTIDTEYDLYRQNCYEAAEYFDFDRALQPFKEYLMAKN